MFDILQSMQASFEDPQRLHAAVVHLPIAAATLGLLLVIMLACTAGKSHGLRWATFAVLAVGALVGWSAEETGVEANEHQNAVRKEVMGMTRAALSSEAQAHLSEHETYGEYVKWALAAAALLTALTAIPAKTWRGVALGLAVLTTLGCAGLVAYVGHHGGALVYLHGVGTPTSPDNLPRVEPEDEQDEPKPEDAEDEASKSEAETDETSTDEESIDASNSDDEAATSPPSHLGQPEPADGDTVFDN